MKTVGEILAEQRKKKKLDLDYVAEKTRIRSHFLLAIEKNKFDRLPFGTSAYGFIKNYAEFLGLGSDYVLAVFRRDFAEDKKGRVIPRGLIKPLDSPRFFSSPKFKYIILILLFLFIISAYLLNQYLSLVRGPFLEIISPAENGLVSDPVLILIGRTEPDAVVKINQEIINIATDGSFEYELDLNEGSNLILIEAVNKLGKSRRLERLVEKN